MNENVDVQAIVEKAGWNTVYDCIGICLVAFIDDRLGYDNARHTIIDDLRSYFSVNVVDRIEDAWIELYGEEKEDE